MHNIGELPDPGLVPEVLVTDLAVSLDFWSRVCGFEVLYGRAEEGFAYLTRGTAHVMLEQMGIGRNWVSGEMTRPLGRGINFQITVPAVEPLVAALRAEGLPLFMEPEVKRYDTNEGVAEVAQFLVQDPDGYLLRFQAPLGRR